MLYDDDGQSFDYEAGRYRWLELKASPTEDGGWQGSALMQEAGWDSFYREVSWEFIH
jgi:Domain of unknown function (DUF5110)